MRSITVVITLAGLFSAPMEPAVAQESANSPPKAIPLSTLKPDLSPLKNWGTRVYQGNRMKPALFSRENVFQQVSIPAGHQAFAAQARFDRCVSFQ